MSQKQDEFNWINPLSNKIPAIKAEARKMGVEFPNNIRKNEMLELLIKKKTSYTTSQTQPDKVAVAPTMMGAYFQQPFISAHASPSIHKAPQNIEKANMASSMTPNASARSRGKTQRKDPKYALPPITDNADQAPVVTNQAPVVTNQAPVVTNQAPIVTNQVTNQAPIVTNQVTNQAPVVTNPFQSHVPLASPSASSVTQPIQPEFIVQQSSSPNNQVSSSPSLATTAAATTSSTTRSPQERQGREQSPLLPTNRKSRSSSSSSSSSAVASVHSSRKGSAYSSRSSSTSPFARRTATSLASDSNDGGIMNTLESILPYILAVLLFCSIVCPPVAGLFSVVLILYIYLRYTH